MRNSFKIIRFAFSLPKFDAKKDFYKALNLSESASPEQIKKSYKDLAKRYHPDVNKGKEQMFKDINEAYQVLSNLQIKKQYDQSRNQAKRSKSFDQSYKQSHSNNSQHYQYYKQQQQRPFSQDQLRQQIRKQNQEIMKKYTQNRNNYDHLGRAYENYEQFVQQTLRKKAEKYQQKTRVTQESVRKQEELKRQQSARRDHQLFIQKNQALKKQIKQKYDKAIENSKGMVDGVKRMGEFVKDLFKKK